MNPTRFLRIAAVLSLLYCLGHASGAPWTPDTGPAGVATVAAMKSDPFDALGSQRTYWDFYVGFGWIISAYLLLQAVVLWQLGALAKTGAPVRPIIAAMLVFCLVNAALAWRYFFILPIVFTIAIATCVVLALVTQSRRPS
jgi:hypothetical protein